MADIVDRATRSRMMSGIRGRDTRPEIEVRKALHARGLRFRVTPKNLPGKPDIVLPKYHAIVFVHGCFWHGHQPCRYFVRPKTNSAFWVKKIRENCARDRWVCEALISQGWAVAIVWECALRKDLPSRSLITQLERFIRGSDDHGNSGKRPKLLVKEFGEQSH